MKSSPLLGPFSVENIDRLGIFMFQTWDNWADDKQSKAPNSDSKYRQMALVGFDT